MKFNNAIANLKIHGLAILVLAMVSCTGPSKSSNTRLSDDKHATTDTVKLYWEPDYNSYTFDTMVNHTHYQMKTYCLNDSAIFNPTDIGTSNQITYSVAHNFATDFIIKSSNDKVVELHLIKENFKDSLPSDFIKICSMWANGFSHVENGQLVFRASFAQPDTDYQMSILYSLSDKGKFKILKVRDESGDE